jgi:hypothetical protein
MDIVTGVTSDATGLFENPFDLIDITAPAGKWLQERGELMEAWLDHSPQGQRVDKLAGNWDDIFVDIHKHLGTALQDETGQHYLPAPAALVYEKVMGSPVPMPIKVVVGVLALDAWLQNSPKAASLVKEHIEDPLREVLQFLQPGRHPALPQWPTHRQPGTGRPPDDVPVDDFGRPDAIDPLSDEPTTGTDNMTWPSSTEELATHCSGKNRDLPECRNRNRS